MEPYLIVREEGRASGAMVLRGWGRGLLFSNSGVLESGGSLFGNLQDFY